MHAMYVYECMCNATNECGSENKICSNNRFTYGKNHRGNERNNIIDERY